MTLERLELSFEPGDLPLSKKGKGRVLPRKNVYFGVGPHGLYVTSEAKQFRQTVRRRAIELGYMREVQIDPVISSGWWRLDVLALAPRRSRGFDVLLPLLDSDGCLSPVKDALAKCTTKLRRGGAELGGVIDNDARIIADTTAIAYRPGRPGLIVRLERVADPQALLRERWPGHRFIGAGDELDDDDDGP